MASSATTNNWCVRVFTPQPTANFIKLCSIILNIDMNLIRPHVNCVKVLEELEKQQAEADKKIREQQELQKAKAQAHLKNAVLKK
jgi:hypothetical protein